MTTSPTPGAGTASPVPVPPARRRLLRLLAVAGAAAAAVLVWVIAVPGIGLVLEVADGRPGSGGATMELGAGQFIVFSVGSALLGWGLLALLERLTAKAPMIWGAIAVAVVLVSLLPLAQPMDGSTRAVLALVHLAVGAAVIIPLLLTSPRRRG